MPDQKHFPKFHQPEAIKERLNAAIIAMGGTPDIPEREDDDQMPLLPLLLDDGCNCADCQRKTASR